MARSATPRKRGTISWGCVDLEILITNAGKEPIEIEYDSWSLKEYQDAHRAADFKIQCSRRIPITRYAHVVATEDSRTFFRGYIQKPSITNLQTRELSCKGEEDLLLRRYTGRYAFQAATNKLVHAFQSDAPSQVADTYGVTGNVGLLFMANSMIPYHGNVITTGTPAYDWFAHEHDWIYYLAGLGSTSRIGNTAAIYAEGKLLPRVADLATLENTAISCYSDADNLWIRLDDTDYNPGFGPKYMILAENCYDTGVRMGTIDLPSTTLTGNLQLSFDRILDVLIDLAEFYGLNPRFRRTQDYTYLDALASPTETEFTLCENQIEEIKQSYNESPRVHALIGKGYGSRDVQQIYTPSDHSWQGIWIEDVTEVDEGFIDAMGNLKPYIDADYAQRLADEMFSISPVPDWDLRPKTNDMIRLKLVGESEKLLQVASTKFDSKGSYEMEIGGRKSDLVDAFNSRNSLNRIYFNEYMVEYGKALAYSGTTIQMGDTTHGKCTGMTTYLTVPAEVFLADWSHRVTLDISISANETPVSCLLLVEVNSTENLYCQPRHYLLNDQISGLDITRIVDYGTPTLLSIWVVKNGEWAGAACANHPTMNITVTVRCFHRAILGDVTRPIQKKDVKSSTWNQLLVTLGRSSILRATLGG